MGELRCDDHSELEAKFIVGNAETGEQSFYCPLCTGIFGLTMALAVLDPHDVAAAANEAIARVAKDGQEGPAKPPARKSKAKKAPAKQTAKPAAEGVEETPPPFTNR